MNRILQKFVGDTSSSSSQRQNGSNVNAPSNMSSGSNWAAGHFGDQAQAPSYPYQQQPASNGSGYGYHNRYQQQQQPQQGYMATNSQGQYLEEIPLSSPQSNSKPNAAALFEDTSHSHQQQSYFGYRGNTDQQQQQYQGAYDQQHPAAADSFFQSSHGASSESSPALSRSASADLFSQPPRSTTSSYGGGFNHFQETAADPFASSSSSLPFATTTPVPTKASSHNGFDQQYNQQYQQDSGSLSRSTSGTASDLFANPPPSSTPSFDGFEQQQQSHPFSENSTAAAFGAAEASSRPSSADLFANSAPAAATASFYDGFAQQPSDSNDGWGSTAGDDLFATTAPAEASTPSPFDGFSHKHQQQQTQEYYYATSAAVTAAISAGEESVNPFASSGASAADPFAHSPGSASSSSHLNNGFSQQSEPAFAESADPFANSTHSFTSSSTNGFEHRQQQEHYYQQQYYDYNSNQEASPFGNSPSTDYHHQADPFASQQPDFGYPNHFQSEQGDPFAQQQQQSSTFGGYQVHDTTAAGAGADTAPVALSPTQVNDFFSEAPPSASSLFSSQPAEVVTVTTESPFKSPQPSPITPTKADVHQHDISFSPGKPVSSSEPSFEPATIPTMPVAATSIRESSITSSKFAKEEETDPVAADDDDDQVAEEITRKLKKTTLDDSHKLVEMYKHMAERLEGEKNELLKVLADQADQFYQMQEYIASLEQELEAHRSSNGQKANQ